jgi:excinuclease ABC subunit A
VKQKESFVDGIVIQGAREHNLKNISLKIPRHKMTVMTGLSGSGKSSLAFDTVYAEGQRRYVEGLSAYARQFLEQLKKPEVDSITGLSPAIAIDQKSVSLNPRSTVGTVTEIYDYLRLLYAKVGIPKCPTHDVPVAQTTPQQILNELFRMKDGTKFYILAPMAQGKKGEFLAEFQKWIKKGFVKARIDGQMVDLDKAKKLAKTKAHDVDLVIDQLILQEKLKSRISESVNTALSMARGHMVIELLNGERKNYSLHAACPQCGYSFPELEPRLFSFNNPRGACETCHGLGTTDLMEVEEFDAAADNKVLKKVTYKYKDQKVSEDDESDEELEITTCSACHGARLKPDVLRVTVGGKNIAEVSDMAADDLLAWTQGLKFTSSQQMIAEKILQQIRSRLKYMLRVGTSYLSMSRGSRTLSGGEAQRIRLATQVGSGLIGVLYVMDEPSIGLHPRDHHRLLEIMAEIRDKGNTLLLVEHDEDTILSADFVVDMGPRAGSEGGQILAQGTPAELMKNPNSITGKYLTGKLQIPVPPQRRQGHPLELQVIGATGNNLKNVDLRLPLGRLIAVTGVSGSGKSTLIMDTLYKELARHFYKAKVSTSPFQKIEGLQYLDKVIDINQRPIGRTPRSTPATYVGLLPMIRDLYAQLPESRLRGLTPGHFSFNVKGGRCEACSGHGQIRMEMHFLSDVFVTCDTCQGARYNRETLNVRFHQKNIADVLAMTVQEAREFFKNHSSISRKLETLHRVGLDYMTLGQSSTTVSGGEAQRIKLSKELSRRGTGKTLYILDEPTTGLHFEDIRKLVELLHELADQGNTVLVIEHHMDVVKCADHVIDLGPEGGRLGGFIVAQGTPEEVANHPESLTGKYLKKVLDKK